MKKSGISLVMETPDAALFRTFSLYLVIFTAESYFSHSDEITKKGGSTAAAFSIPSVNVDVCATVHPHPFFFLLAVVCISGPCTSDSGGMETSPQAIQSDLIKRE